MDKAPNNFKGQEDDEDSIEALKESLYSRHDYFSQQKSRTSFKPHDVSVPKNWTGGEAPVTSQPFSNAQKSMSFLKKIFIASIIFFFASVSVSVYIFFVGGNTISSNNVDISVNGPVSSAGGEILPIEVTVANQNNIDFANSDLVIVYPDGTRDANNTTLPLKRYREALGAIPKGGRAVKKVTAVLFGEEGDIKDIDISVEYRVKGSNAIFSKEKKYSVSLSSAPVTMTASSVKEINANQAVELSVDVVSNASSVIQKLSVSVEYPFGFTFGSSEPSPSWSNSFWQLGDLKPGVKRTIKIKGTIAGQDNDDRSFRFSVGTEDPNNENVIGTNFLTNTQKITIKKPFIGTTLALDGDLSDVYLAKAGKTVRADLTIGNNLGIKITDVKIFVKPTGAIFDPNLVTVSNGFYRSSDRTITWDQTLKNSLAVFNPDDTETLSFSLGMMSEEQIRAIKNPEMTIGVTVQGKRLNEVGLSADVSSTISKTIRLASTLGLSTRAVYYSGAFVNVGPLPPKVDSETSYTVVWSLTNGSNDLTNTRVSATLPSYVKWLNAFAPQGEKISYNPIGGQVVWDALDLKAGTGFSGSPREVSFQVSLTPSTSQINSTPSLMTEASATGDDAFAGASIQTGSRAPLTTELRTDVNFKAGQGVVTK